MAMAMPSTDEKLKLNVGGVRFETSRSVLTKITDSMLGRMFGSCDIMLQVDPDDGSHFIDRDGERFKLILDFLRAGDSSQVLAKTIRGLSEVQQQAMMCDLDFFGLEEAVFGTRPWIEDATFALGPEMNEERGYFGAA